MSSGPLDARFAELLAAGGVTAAAGLVAGPDGVRWTAAGGQARRAPPVPAQISTRFDLASLTKPFTATLAAVLDRRGRLPLAAAVGEVWPEAHRDLARQPLAALLRHRAGFIPWTPLYHRCRGPDEVRPLLLSGRLLGARAGTYSDLGPILWGLAAEARLGRPLPDLLREHVLDPLDLGRTGPSPGDRPEVAECPLTTAREVQLAAEQGLAIAELPAPAPGRVQDGNARFLGGLAGHAGLFASAPDLARLALEWLAPGRLLDRETVAGALSGRGRFALGWARRRVRGSAGPALGRAAFGHTGFTGGSLWLDPEAGRILVLLAHRTAVDVDLDPWRRRFHAAAARL